MNSQELRNLQEAYLEVYQNQNIAENKSGLRGSELSNSGSSKGTPKPGSASVSTSGPSSPGYDTRRLGGSDLRRLSTPSSTLQPKGTYKPGSASVSVSKPVRSREFAREDMFDVVKGHLLDEGYADTEEAALAIMANMSEEWRDNIIEQSAIAARAAKVVGDQRQGYAGDADAINKMQDATSKSIGKLKRGQGPVVTPGLPGV
jgi:hypothetical protein